MKVLTCVAARRRLEAFHDEELPIGEQISVNAHLEWCEGCAAVFRELRVTREAVRRAVPARIVLSDEERVSLQASVVSRARAEESVSLEALVRDMFQDMHFVYAGLGAAAAALVCVVITLGMMRIATSERPEALVAMVKGPELLGSNQNPVSADIRIRMPRALDERFSTSARVDGADAVVALAAVVTREGRVASLELLRAQGTPWIAPGNDEATLVNEMLGAASEARFEPASVAGLPVAVSVVWIVAHTTVRGTTGTLGLPAPAGPRRRAASVGLLPPPRSLTL